MKNKRARELEFAHCFLINFTYAKLNFLYNFFYLTNKPKYFLISPILFEGSTLINLCFLIEKDVLCGVSISDFNSISYSFERFL